MGDGIADLGMPGVLRVIFGFLITAGLAVGAVYAIRRFSPATLLRATAGKRIRALSRAAISRTVTVHLIEVDGERVLVAEGRVGVGMTVLGRGGEVSTAEGAPAERLLAEASPTQPALADREQRS